MEKRSFDWNKWFIIGGAVMGLAFAILFIRAPRWMGDGNLTALIIGWLYLGVIYAGAVAGHRAYKQYACKLNLHSWDDSFLPRRRDCRLCGRCQRPVDLFNDDAGWKDVHVVRDELTGRFSFTDVSPPLESRSSVR